MVGHTIMMMTDFREVHGQVVQEAQEQGIGQEVILLLEVQEHTQNQTIFLNIDRVHLIEAGRGHMVDQGQGHTLLVHNLAEKEIIMKIEMLIVTMIMMTEVKIDIIAIEVQGQGLKGQGHAVQIGIIDSILYGCYVNIVSNLMSYFGLQ